MAKSVRAKSMKRNQARKQVKLRPILAETDRKRSIRLRAYMSLQQTKIAQEKGEQVDEQTQLEAKHAEELNRNDEQKRYLRDKGHFFHCHPSVDKEKTFPTVSNPDGKIEVYSHEMDAKDKDVGRISVADYRRYGIGPKKLRKKHNKKKW